MSLKRFGSREKDFFVIFLIAVSAIGLIVMVYFGDMVLNLIGFVVAMIIFFILLY